MKRWISNIIESGAALVLLAVVQTAVETLVISGLYANYIMPPKDFFNIRMYDGFTKIFSALESRLSEPFPVSEFFGQGFSAKLSVGFELLAMNLAVAGALALIVGTLLTLFGRDLGADAPASRRRIVLFTGLALIIGHLTHCYLRLHLPNDPTWIETLRNTARNFIHDGTVVAIGVVILSVPIALLLNSSRLLRPATTTASVVLALAAFVGTFGISVHVDHVAARPIIAKPKALTGAAPKEAVAPKDATLDAGPIEGAIETEDSPSSGVNAPAIGGRETANGDDPSVEEEETDALAEPAEPVGPVAKDYNVILISIDSLRADHLGAYGYPRDTSPTIKALAEGGILCANASSTTSWTLPSHMSMLTGRSLLGHGVVSDDRTLTDDVPTLAESFSDAGYRTHAIVSAPYVEARFGFDRGFDSYDDTSVRFETHGQSYKSVTAPMLQATAAEWLRSKGDKKFFLFLHYWDVHYDYTPGPVYDTMFDPDYTGSITGENFYFNDEVNRNMDPRDLEHILALYDGEIRLVDDHLAKLRAVLAELSIDNNTIIVVTSDHGDEFFEHGRKGHHRTLYDEQLRVPLIFYVPGVKLVRPRLEMETSTVDIFPTVLGFTGIEAPGRTRRRRSFGRCSRKARSVRPANLRGALPQQQPQRSGRLQTYGSKAHPPLQRSVGRGFRHRGRPERSRAARPK